jgi:hypothetical protein
MSHRSLRSYSTFLILLGWLHVVVFVLLGFAPWFVLAGRPTAPETQWEQWLIYAGPAIGLLVGGLSGLGYFVLSGVIRVFLDQRDLLEDLVQTQHRLLQLGESGQVGGHAAAQDPFDLTGINDTDEPHL